MLCFTRADFNNLLNFTDLRANELTLRVGGAVVAARELVSRFVSNVDVIMDRVDPGKLAARLDGVQNFSIEVERSYPFHDVLIRPCLDLSIHHRFAYSPVLWIGRNVDLPLTDRIDGCHPVYGTLFEGKAGGLVKLNLANLTDRPAIHIDAFAVGALFVPNVDVQAEVGRRVQIIGKVSADRIAINASSPIDPAHDEGIFIRALKSLWPAEAMGRLSTYIYLREGRPDVRAFGVDTSLEGKSVPGKLGVQYEEIEVAPSLIVSKAPNASLPRSPELDALAIRGVVTYRAGEWSSVAGWPVYVSSRDPEVVVRSNGVVRWLRLGHGEIESIERLEDERNLALGARTAWELYGHLAPDRMVLFAGLGLGVVQRSVAMDTRSVTCEINPSVVDAFNYIFPDIGGRLRIVVSDFYDFVRDWPSTDPFEMAFLDFLDVRDSFFEAEVIAEILRIARVVVINKHIRSDTDLRACEEAIASLPFAVERHLVEGKQLILAVRAHGEGASG